MTINVDNQEHTNEQQSQHTFTVKEEATEPNTPPTKLEIKKEYKPLKSNIGFTKTQFEKMKISVGIFKINLQSANEEDKTVIVRCIDDQIKLHHVTFVKEFREFKKNKDGISQSFITDFFTHCENKLKEEVNLISKGNAKGKADLEERMLKHISEGGLTEYEMLLLNLLFPKHDVSEAKRKEQIDRLSGKK